MDLLGYSNLVGQALVKTNRAVKLASRTLNLWLLL